MSQKFIAVFAFQSPGSTAISYGYGFLRKASGADAYNLAYARCKETKAFLLAVWHCEWNKVNGDNYYLCYTDDAYKGNKYKPDTDFASILRKAKHGADEIVPKNMTVIMPGSDLVLSNPPAIIVPLHTTPKVQTKTYKMPYVLRQA